MVEGLSSNQFEAFPEMLEAIRCLRAYGLKTALLTNNWFVDENKTKTLLPVDSSLFDVVCTSDSIYMGGRLPAVAGMSANRTFLELSAGQSDWPEKNCVVLLPKKRRRPVSFHHEEKRFSLWTAPCLSIKSGVYRVTYAIFRLPS